MVFFYHAGSVALPRVGQGRTHRQQEKKVLTPKIDVVYITL